MVGTGQPKHVNKEAGGDMAVHFGCVCPERKKPIKEREWVVSQRNWNSGSFVKEGGEWSRYSDVRCLQCGAIGRSKSKYVDELDDMDFFKAMNIFLENEKKRIRDGKPSLRRYDHQTGN